MTSRSLHLEGSKIRSEGDFYDALASAFPEISQNFGRNLDALWDVLSGVIEGPVEISWSEAGLSAAAMGPRFWEILGVLREAAASRGDLTLRIDDPQLPCE